jgi:hypothetical protein
MTRRQRARERRGFNRARRCGALREPFRGWRWSNERSVFSRARRWWAAWHGTRAQRRAADAAMGDAFE